MGAGDLYLQSGDRVIIGNWTNLQQGIIYNEGAQVSLFHNGVLRLETTSDGVDITGNLDVTGDITAFATSDGRLKADIKPIEDPLAKVLNLEGVTYTWNEKSTKEGERDTGVIAQHVEALGLPGITTTRDDGTMAVNYDKLVPILIGAIKELSAKVDALS